MMSKVQCLFCFENCTPEGRGGGKGGSANFKTRQTEPFILEYPAPVYVNYNTIGGDETDTFLKLVNRPSPSFTTQDIWLLWSREVKLAAQSVQLVTT